MTSLVGHIPYRWESSKTPIDFMTVLAVSTRIDLVFTN
jgi:hypothetical protein